MNPTNRLRAVLFTTTIIAILFNIWYFRPQEVEPSHGRKGIPPRIIPPEGFCFNDTGGKVLGNPERAIKDAHELYRLMSVYKSRHGEFPPTDSHLFNDAYTIPTTYGFANALDAAKWGINPDMKYADIYHNQRNPEQNSAFRMASTRPDGSKRFGTKEPKKRDVLAFSEVYFFRNECVFPDGRSTKNPVGFYIVIWEDGEVAKVPHDKVRYARPQRSTYDQCFPSQAGLPEATYTHEEAKMHTAPLGTAGADATVQMSAEAKRIIAEATKGIPARR